MNDLHQAFLIATAGAAFVDQVLFGTGSIHLAAAANDRNKIEDLLRQAPSLVYRKDVKHKQTALFYALRHNHQDLMEWMISQQGFDVNHRRLDGQTCLHIACSEGRKAMVLMLLNQHANPSIIDLNGTTVLMASIDSEDAVITQAILAYHEHFDRHLINTTNRQGKTAIFMACQQGKTECMRLLLEAGADPVRLPHHDTNDDDSSLYERAEIFGYQRCAALLKGWEFIYTLNKLRGIRDGLDGIEKAAEANEAVTNDDIKKARIKAAPSYLRRRLERDGEEGDEELPLPELEWMVVDSSGESEEEAEKERRRREKAEEESSEVEIAIAATVEEGCDGKEEEEEEEGRGEMNLVTKETIQFVIEELKGDLYRELMIMMGRSMGWALGPGEEDYLMKDYDEEEENEEDGWWEEDEEFWDEDGGGGDEDDEDAGY